DRAASFTASVVPSPDGNTAGADAFAAFPPGSAYPGRVLAAGRWGVNVSDDGGQTFREGGLWEVLLYNGEAVGVVERPGGGHRAVLGGRQSGLPGRRAWVSDDGGESWGPGGGVALPGGPPEGVGGAAAGARPPGGAAARTVVARGRVDRTDEGGETGEAVGRAPEISDVVLLSAAALGPDRRLYVGLSEIGGLRAWVYRTQEVHEPNPVPSEPEPEGEESLGLAV